ncbi:Protein esc2 [Mortierella alpina]|nr:Protein esc2 [Mortierella alpina]
MSDSDDSTPVKRKPQPKPRPRRMARRVSSDSAGSPHGLTPSGSGMASPTSSQGAATSPSQQKRRNEDDFFNKARYYRDIVKVQETSFREEKEPEMEDTSTLDSMLTTNEQPLSDLEDDLTPKKAPEVVKKAPEVPKRKRELSLTPPPELPTRQYRRVDPVYPYPSTSIGLIDIDDDNGRNDDLDPELASIAAQITSTSQQSAEGASPAGSGPASSQQGLSQSPASQLSNSQSSASNPASATIPTTNGTASQVSTSSALAPQNDDGSESEVVHVLLRWQDHPQSVNDPVFSPLHAQVLQHLRLPIKVVVKANKSFRDMMEHYCRVKQIAFSDVVFLFRNARLMPSSTPESLEFPRFSVIDVCKKETYKFMKDQEARERSMKLAELEKQEAELARIQAPDNPSESNETEQDSQDADADYLYIKLRGKDTTDLKIRVKPSTTVQAILSHYKNLKKIGADVPVRLEFDDEAMDPSTTVGNTDIEDDDMLLVRIG